MHNSWAKRDGVEVPATVAHDGGTRHDGWTSPRRARDRTRSLMSAIAMFVTPPPSGKRSIVMSAYLSVCVCLSVRDHILGTARLIFTKILCMIPVAVVRSSSGSVLICYVGLLPVFTADVIFAHKPRLLHVAGQLKRSAHAALGSAIKRVQ